MMRRFSRDACPGLEQEALLAHRLQRFAECREGRCRQAGLIVERAETRATPVMHDADPRG